MRMRVNGFNPYLLVLTALFVGVGCQTTESKKKKEISTLRVHLSMPARTTAPGQMISVMRENPLPLKIEPHPFLNESLMTNAVVFDVMGGHAIRLTFDHRGALLLEQYTVANKGRHLAIFSQFGETPDQSRWLAAPLIQQGITNGQLAFTPDATREEAERVVNGLMNLDRKRKKKRW